MPVHSDQAVIEYPEYAAKLVSNMLVLPVHWFANGLFDWNLNLAPYRKYYQNAIERTFHISPCDSDRCYRNASTFLGQLVNVCSDKKVTFSEMQTFLMKNKHLPSFIINATVKIDEDDLEHRAANLYNSVFEFMPFRFGSDSFGYRKIPDACDQRNGCPIDMHTAIAISGAAVDSSIMSKKLQGLSDVVNLNLGYRMPNYNLKTSQRVKHNLLPFPFYYAYRDKYDIRGTTIYLTDGGHSENLGAFSLIKRMVKNIIIIDAEYDPDYDFTAYRKLKKRLKSEFGVTLCVKGIDPQQPEVFDLQSNQQIFDDQLSEEMIERLYLSRTEVPKVTYMESVGDTWSIEDRALNKKYIAKIKDGALFINPKYSGIQPVMKGSVSWFPLGGSPQMISEKITINVIYVKLSLNLTDDGNISGDYPQSIRHYYNVKGKDKKKYLFWKATSFPHENTSDISYGKNQFEAYRDLGEYIIRSNARCFEDVY
jgi:hypothetical protein